MTVPVVRVPYVVDLEAEGVLQVVARLLITEPGHDCSPLADIYDVHPSRFRQRAGGLVNPVR